MARRIAISLALLVSLAPLASAVDSKRRPVAEIQENVRRELIRLPWYSIFDFIEFRVVEDNHVILTGHVTRPVLKSDAAGVVWDVKGVERVTNNIEVLPLSTMDDRIRRQVASSIYGFGPLQRYSLGALPSIHIIVKNGHVILKGWVANTGDKTFARIRANTVGGVFSVTDELMVPSRG